VKIPKIFETTPFPKSPTGFFAMSLLYLFGGPRSFKIRHQAIPQLKKFIHASDQQNILLHATNQFFRSLLHCAIGIKRIATKPSRPQI